MAGKVGDGGGVGQALEWYFLFGMGDPVRKRVNGPWYQMMGMAS